MKQKESKKIRRTPISEDPLTRREPISPDAERGVIAAVFKEPQFYKMLKGELEPKHFGVKTHCNIWLAFWDLDSRGESIDVLSVSTSMVNDGLLDPVASYEQTKIHPTIMEFAELIDGEINFDVVEFAKRVKKWAGLREVIKTCKTAIDACYDTDSPAEVIAEATRKLAAINTSETEELKHISVPLKAVISELYEPAEKIQQLYIDTGFKPIDAVIGGIGQGTITAVVARHKVGKSTFCMQIVENATYISDAVNLYFMLEMNDAMLVRRYIQQKTGINVRDVLRGKKVLNSIEMELFKASCYDLQKKNIWIVDKGCHSIAQIRNYIYRFKAKKPDKKIGWVVVDHWNLLDVRHARSETEAQEENAKDLNDLIKEINARGLIPAQCRKPENGKEDKAPTIHEVKGSGALAEIVTNAIILHRPTAGTGDTGAKEPCQVIMALGRESKGGGQVNLFYDPMRVMFTEAR